MSKQKYISFEAHALFPLTGQSLGHSLPFVLCSNELYHRVHELFLRMRVHGVPNYVPHKTFLLPTTNLKKQLLHQKRCSQRGLLEHPQVLLKHNAANQPRALGASAGLALLCDIPDSSTLRKLRATPEFITDILTLFSFPQHHRAATLWTTRNIVILFFGNNIVYMLNMLAVCLK